MSTFIRSNALPTTLSLGALTVASLAFVREPADAGLDTTQLVDKAEFTQVRRALANLEQRATTLERKPLSAQAPARVEVRDDTDLVQTVAKLTNRIARLEQLAQQRPPLKSKSFDGSPLLREAIVRGSSLPPEQREKKIAGWQAQATNAALDAEIRLGALRRLRSSGKGARGGAVLDAMVQLAQTSKDPSVRADVWRQMSGAHEPRLVTPLIQAALHDKDRKVREEAIETLGDYLDDASARQTLEHIQANDPDEDVREEAEKSIYRGKRDKRRRR